VAYSSNIKQELLHHGDDVSWIKVMVESRRTTQHTIKYAHVNLKMVVWVKQQVSSQFHLFKIIYIFKITVTSVLTTRTSKLEIR